MPHQERKPVQAGPAKLSRRRFVQGLVAGGAIAGLGFMEKPVWAVAQQGTIEELRGTEFDLTIGEAPVNFTGSTGIATAVNGQVPAPILRWREGDIITLRVTNRLQESTSIHWHGIILPNPMDGVPGMTFAGIAPGETFTYRFPVIQSGTYWYHSHTGFQEQTGLYGSIVIEPRTPAPFHHDRDHVVMLSDWTDDSPEHVFSRLKKMDGYYNYAQLTVGDFIEHARKEGISNALSFRGMWDQMRMSPRDLADVSGNTYTYLMNGATPAGNWNALFRRGEKVLLRFINGSAMSYFDVRIPGLEMTVVAADGQYVQPVSVDEFRIGVAETYDVIVEPVDDNAYTIFAQSMDRSGYARGTLAPKAGMSALVPPLDTVPTLTMADMGMSMEHMAGMEMPGDGDMQGMDHGSGATDTMVMSNGPDAAASGMTMQEVGADPMAGMTMSGHAMNHGGMSGVSDVGGMAMEEGGNGGGMMSVQHHPATERGPGAGMQASVVSTRLDDPGVGLRNNGRRVLTYADLRGMDDWIDTRTPSRTIEIHLTGNMERYMWSFDGVKFSDAEPIHLKYGELVRIVLVNDTMMEHPIHLHGMWSEMENANGGFQVRKHTISVKPGHAISYRVLADAKGRWAYHCHLLFHMKAGMFREVRVA